MSSKGTHELRAFRATDPLTPGTTLVEASAGTGKTYNITNLFVRLVAEEGMRVDEILVVTFTRAATAELRTRIRERLVEASRAVEAALASTDTAPPDDEVLALLALGTRGTLGTRASGDPPSEREVLALRGERLRRAQEDFDLAAVSTIHSFCERALQFHAFESEVPFDLELVQDVESVRSELVDDWLARELSQLDDARHRAATDDCALTRASLLELARVATGTGEAPLEPSGPEMLGFRRAYDAWHEGFSAFVARWRAGAREEVRAAIHAAILAGELEKATYKPNKTDELLAKVDAWLAAEGRGVDLTTANRAYFSPEQLAKKSKRGALSERPIFAELASVLSGGGWQSGPRAAFAAWARRELPARLAARNQQSFDELLRTLRARVVDPLAGPPLVRAVRARYGAALIDEFQDTDDTQWAIFEALFGGDSGAHLYLIGDPKQAIYSFRGADVFVYERAKEATERARRFTMTVNQRSTEPYVAAMNRLFGGRSGVFDLEFIDYVPVEAAARNRRAGLRAASGDGPRAPLRLRWFGAEARGLSATSPAAPSAPASATPCVFNKGEAKQLVPALLAADVVELLGSGTEIARGEGFGEVAPRDVAVLVRTNAQAAEVHEALLARGVPAIVAKAGSVIESDEAEALERWLAALDAPGRDGPARALAVSTLFGWTARELVAAQEVRASGEAREAGDARWTRWLAAIAAWRALFDARGFSAAFARSIDDERVLATLLTLPDGERRVTNVRHLAELLHVRQTTDRLGVAGLLQWLRLEREATGAPAEEAELRLESDADAVQVVTMHASKGLQYPIVFLPYLWEGSALSPRDQHNLRFHDRARDGRPLAVDLRLDTKSEPKPTHLAWATEEQLQEALRLLYVGFTRARHHAVAYAGPVSHYERSPLGVVLHGDPASADGAAQAGAGSAPQARRVDVARERIKEALEHDDASLRADLERLARGSELAGMATIELSVCPPPRAEVLAPRVGDDPRSLTAREFRRASLDDGWARSSFTALTRGKELAREAGGARDAGHAESAREGEDFDDVALAPGPSPRATEGGAERPLADVALFALAGGTEIGKYVHKLLELLDFRTLHEKVAPRRPLAALVAALGDRMGVASEADRALLVAHLPDVLATPLGEALGDRALADVALGDRLDELKFDLPLAGGDAFLGDGAIDGRALGAIFARRHGLGLDTVMRASYVAQLAALDFGQLAGFLTGSVDLVFRVLEPARGGGEARWFIVDYKTNLLGPRPGGGRVISSTLHDYALESLRAEMEHNHYYVQYHLYLVALHRYLRHRVSDYDYDRHVGGAAYLFLRGMAGRDAPRDGERVPGVFFDRPPREVIEGLSELFDAREGSR
jgi:exodeoxyribonuclease V beta subunit